MTTNKHVTTFDNLEVLVSKRLRAFQTCLDTNAIRNM